MIAEKDIAWVMFITYLMGGSVASYSYALTCTFTEYITHKEDKRMHDGKKMVLIFLLSWIAVIWVAWVFVSGWIRDNIKGGSK